MYYEIDGDYSCYNIKLFISRVDCEKYLKEKGNVFSHTTEIEVTEPSAATETKPNDSMACPECGKKMVSRKGTYGMFWGCSTYPKCKGTRDEQGRSKEEKRAEREQAEPADEKYRFRR
jgi:ssDNA-binding Zn-finger/Zn-ribbon topoisomerase 1